jgi:UDP-N-acetylmuramoyl-tripeptide--D-alanyl-D-alanine ligase
MMAGRPIPLTAAGMADAMGGHVSAGNPATVPAGFAIDSRVLEPAQAFFAIVAARDGHEFVADAVARGAAIVVVSRPVTLASGASTAVVTVDDTTRGLQGLARHVRRASGARIVAITGSAGKTTTKEAVAEFLSAKYAVVRNAGNLNNHLGLPLSLLDLRHGADVGVMELGMNHAGEIRVLVGIAEPDVRVWTNVGDAHVGYFGSPEGIADAKAEILEGADAGTVLVANADDARVMARARRFAGRLVTFGESETADVRAVDVEDAGLDGTRATIVTRDQRRRLHLSLVGRGHLSNVLCATAVAMELGVTLDEVAERAKRLKPARRRGEVRVLGGLRLVDDSYNSSPSALTQALDALARDLAARRRVAVVGEMLELGDLSVPLHEVCGRLAARAGLAMLVTVGGPPARALGRAAVAEGMAEEAVRHFETSEQAAAGVPGMLAAGDAVLVKGSRGTRTDLVADRIVAVFG